jgi:AraC-like DNA-binding protein
MPADPSVELFSLLPTPYSGEELFDCMVDLVYFVKNERAEYVVVNRTLVERCGLREKRDLIGRTTEDIFPAPLGRSFREQDEALIRSGAAVVNQLELHLYPGREMGWCLTNKLPLRAGDGRVVGLVGASRDLQAPGEEADGHEDVARAVRHARDHLEDRPTLGALAGVAGLSPYQFDRRVRKLFRLTTGQLLLKLRIDAAAERLRDTAMPVATVALACGYSDQSAFTRQFRRTIGLTPGEYRSAYRSASGGTGGMGGRSRP